MAVEVTPGHPYHTALESLYWVADAAGSYVKNQSIIWPVNTALTLRMEK